MTKNIIISVLSLVSFCVTPLFAQESCYEQYLREHNKKILTAEDADDSYDELKKTVLAKQMYGDSYLLMVDTVAQRAVMTKVDGTYIADVHVALVDSTWYMWLSVDPLADKNIGVSPYIYCNGNPVMLIDPDGRDVWELTDDGVVLNIIADETRDAFRVKGKELSLEPGAVSTFSQEKKFGGGTTFVFEKGRENDAAEVFKFLADNTKVEYGLINTKGEVSTILTDHNEHSVNAYSRLSTTNDVSSFYHNHPGGSLNASGYGDSYRGDRRMASSLDSNIDLYLYSGNQIRQYLPSQQVSFTEPWPYAPVGKITNQKPSLLFRVINAIIK